MQAKPRKVTLLRSRGFIEPRQHTGNLVRVMRANFTPVVFFVKTFQAAMPEMPYHHGFVK
jgi:hypothetical protein